MTLYKRITGFLPANGFLNYVVVSLSQFQHALFKLLNIFLGQRVLHIHVVVKAVVDDRTNGHFNIRIELFNRMP